jgi:hypothetical protein
VTGTTRARRLLSIALGAAPILLLLGTAVLPAAVGDRHGTDRAETLRMLQAIAPDRSRLPIGLVLVVLGLALLVVAAFGLVWLAGGSRLALTGAALVTIAGPAGAVVNTVNDLVPYRLTDPHLAQASAVDVLAGSIGPVAVVLFVLYLLLLPGLILLAIAAARTRSLRWWQSALIGVGALLGLLAGEGPAGALFSIPLCVGMFLAARQLAAGDGTSQSRTDLVTKE